MMNGPGHIIMFICSCCTASSFIRAASAFLLSRGLLAQPYLLILLVVLFAADVDAMTVPRVVEPNSAACRCR